MICGIDEAGRGCLCGSLFVAGVVCNDKNALFLKNHGVRDSKTTTKSQRQKLFALITNTKGIFFHVVEKTSNQIDQKSLSACLKESIQEICIKLTPYSKNFLLDGNTTFHSIPPKNSSLQCIIKGDNKITQIAAASILAKYFKDLEMQKLHVLYPDYHFIQHSGYGTKKHLEKIKTLGYTPYHRKSFIIKKSLLDFNF
ncbi:ribonuclease HII [Helicobacter anatolicus]|uniref:ribonuclease HII n=1 Tax=Helicobacter anatolicus TaxID=2905874 RepID=UPI001E53B69F|nr:ribonuclease HII [Helicobacter anatolicus]MCE3037712.1 ribonuclease HII [Helicobacter anatolicus]